MASLYDFYKKVYSDNLCFIYQGEFSDSMTEKVLSISEYNMDNVKELAKFKRKVSFLMAESFQNIIRHGGDGSGQGSRGNTGLFMTRNIGNVIYINSANLIDNKFIPDLKIKLSKINSLEKDSLKELYLEILSKSEVSAKGGAGLGLIEMARRSGQKLEYDFIEIDQKYSYFYLGVTLKGLEGNDNEKETLGVAKFFHQEMLNENILVSYKGDFSQNSIMPVLKMVEESIELSSEITSVKKKVFLILVELSQNISMHSYVEGEVPEGLILVSKNKERYFVNAGNILLKSEVEPLKAHIDLLNGLEKEELMKLYRKLLRYGSASQGKGSGLGLIDIANDSKGKIEYEFIPISEKHVFYSIKISI